MKKHIIYLIIITILSIITVFQCSKSSNLGIENTRLNNNISAILDTLHTYLDENGRIISEKQILQLKQEELLSEIDVLKKKNREILTYNKTVIHTTDTITVPTYITQENNSKNGTIRIFQTDTFVKSSRTFDGTINFNISNDSLTTSNLNLNLSQNIFVESIIEKDKKGNTYVRLFSDYPNLSFNGSDAVLVSNAKSYENSIKKSKGVGFAIGPSVGLSYDFINHKIVPTVGFNITFGWTYTPKFLQY